MAKNGTVEYKIMAYVFWFQRKIMLIVAFVIVSIFCLLHVFCSHQKGKWYSLFQNTRDEIEYLESKLKNLQQRVELQGRNDILPIIYLITPTYKRYTQQADLVRMSNTLKHVANIHWILVEDSESKTLLVTSFLSNVGIKYTHLNVRTQRDLILQGNDPRWKKHRGVDQRNHALSWLRNNVAKDTSGVVYFADDDNTYHLDLFKEMRWTRKVSMWPVALVGGLRWEGPICKDGKVVKFFTAWMPSRQFPVDMAAFAINLKILFNNPKSLINPEVKRGWLESDFLQQLKINVGDVEAKANDCTRILVWHTQTAEPKMKEEFKLLKLGRGSNTNIVI
ncbi:galactosylgalactosylxylosylprotein 3-beta-glucuronosyltransferase 3-like [Hydractinia symbiolongicarpus]|uniref:galactosylgalactosylxylosylprotein 3-beta-glucuronosyltransferase 3-like n=1 Tax=Hydractinia symbiolongicarpus TaxID=13093 RepID=UPI00254C7DC6|nr:galactosylgalactosylxylosylprotein 3-beta-glucuronosyltransferase 3-like [Hydractinia symbiolongicarpus]